MRTKIYQMDNDWLERCARCKYAKCEQQCMFGGHCPLYSVFGCRCDLIVAGAPCPHFKEESEDG